MSTSSTRSSTFTLTHARYLGGKISADLRLLNACYGRPSLGTIDDYAEEAALLLKDGYLKTVDFGFRGGDGAWRLRLRYSVTVGGQLVDDRPGRLPAHLALEDFSFYSHLVYSPSFYDLKPEQRAAVKAVLPISRVSAAEPTTGQGSTTSGHGYSAGGTGVARDVYTNL